MRWPSPGPRPRAGSAMGLSSFASKPIEDVVAANPQTFFQTYWMGGRDVMVDRIERARDGRRGRPDPHHRLVVLPRTGLGQPVDPRADRPPAMLRSSRPRSRRSRAGCCDFARAGGLPDLTAPNLVPPGGAGARRSSMPMASGCGRRRPRWDDVAWLVEQWDGPLMLKG